jgi:hypothetical protein
MLARATAVSKVYGEGALATPVLFDVTLELPAGELTLLMGPSGSGKTTLLSILAGLLRPSRGEVELCGQSIGDAPAATVTRARRHNLGFVFQTYNLFPALTALENVAEVLAMKGVPLVEARARAAAALERVGLGARLHHVPAKLSGGAAAHPRRRADRGARRQERDRGDGAVARARRSRSRRAAGDARSAPRALRRSRDRARRRARDRRSTAVFSGGARMSELRRVLAR